jgi:Protein of unknown function (DUF2934)
MARGKSPETTPAGKPAPRKRAAIVEAEAPATRPNFVDLQQRASLIARAAYLRALERGFAPGNEVADWLAAEAEVDAELLMGTAGTSTA